MKITRTAQMVNGKLIWEPPFSQAELESRRISFGEMCQNGTPPASMGTDRAFLQGRQDNHGLGDLPKWMQDSVLAKAKAAGIDISGKVYSPGFSRRGKGGGSDPMAWVSDTHDMLSRAKKLNLNISGVVNYQGEEMPPPPDVPLSEKLIKANMQEYIAKEPEKARDLRELREEVIHKHGAPARKKATKKVDLSILSRI